jgi:Cu(I)/Ag(I) efflux system membrane fusion protein
MKPSARILGALTLATGLAATIIIVAPTRFPRFEHWLAAKAAQRSNTPTDPPVFYRDPMGQKVFSRTPRKDRMGMDFLPVRRSDIETLLTRLPGIPAHSAEEPLFYRDAMGGSEISSVPKTDSMGMDFLPVRVSQIAGLLPPIGDAPYDPGEKRILFYRNPMGLPDTSPVPKKDSMGMDYRPVYEGDDGDDGIVKVAPGKIQRTGVRSEPAQRKPVVSTIRVPGSIQLDERRLTVVATRSPAFIEKVADVTTGDQIKKGQMLVRLYSPEITDAAALYVSVGILGGHSDATLTAGARRRLENLAVPAEYLAEVVRTHKVPQSVVWSALRDSTVLERAVSEGMKVEAGGTLFRLADLSVVWALVDVSEQDYERIKPGQTVAIRARGLSDKVFTGRVGLIYPQVNKETRTVRVRVELANPERLLRPDMYVDAEIAAGDGGAVTTVPDTAIIDTGTRRMVILDVGDGRFEPRTVKTGRRGDGLVEIREGVKEGEKVVVAANFLIDAESNLKSALNGMRQTEAGQ